MHVAAVLPLLALVQLFDDCGAVISGILRAQGKQVCFKTCPTAFRGNSKMLRRYWVPRLTSGEFGSAFVWAFKVVTDEQVHIIASVSRSAFG